LTACLEPRPRQRSAVHHAPAIFFAATVPRLHLASTSIWQHTIQSSFIVDRQKAHASWWYRQNQCSWTHKLLRDHCIPSPSDMQLAIRQDCIRKTPCSAMARDIMQSTHVKSKCSQCCSAATPQPHLQHAASHLCVGSCSDKGALHLCTNIPEMGVDISSTCSSVVML
jgi:hypothetical protein